MALRSRDLRWNFTRNIFIRRGLRHLGFLSLDGGFRLWSINGVPQRWYVGSFDSLKTLTWLFFHGFSRSRFRNRSWRRGIGIGIWRCSGARGLRANLFSKLFSLWSRYTLILLSTHVDIFKWLGSFRGRRRRWSYRDVIRHSLQVVSALTC